MAVSWRDFWAKKSRAGQAAHSASTLAQVIGDGERNPTKTRIRQNWAALLDSASCDLGLGTKKGSGAHAQTASQMLLLKLALPTRNGNRFARNRRHNAGAWSRQCQSRVNG
jgi:hypothetical protein